MKAFLRSACGALALVIASTAVAERTTPTFTSTVVFGDSLVDAGNAQHFFGAIFGVDFSSQGYFNGRFTNGYDYPDLISIGLTGQPTVSSDVGGTNFAWAGARIIGGGLPGISAQIDSYVASLSGHSVDPNSLFILTAGANDFFAAGTGDYAGYGSSTEYLHAAMDKYALAVQRLNDLGARNILITNVLPAGGTGVNEYLHDRLGQLTLSSTTSVFEGDLAGLVGPALANPGSYGLPDWNLSQTCQQAAAWPACTGFFFFDASHPTAAVQKVIFDGLNAEYALTSAVPEPQVWLMLLGGLGLLATRRHQRGDRNAAAGQPAIAE